MKMDAVTDRLIQQIDQPVVNDFTAKKLMDQLLGLDGKLMIQTIFLRGQHRGVSIDNTRDEDVDLWIEALQKIRPQKVMIYTISRETPVKSLQKIPLETLERIADKVKKAGFDVTVAG